MTTRLYYQISLLKWLFRIDWCEQLPFAASEEDSKAGCKAAFGIPVADIAIIETEALTKEDRDALRLAVDWAGDPPGLPTPSSTPTGKLLRPPPGPPSPFPSCTHWAIVEAINPALAKPLRARRTWEGHEYTFNCYVATEIVDLWQAGRLGIGDFVIVDFVDEDPDLPLATLKVFKSW